ncbi:hypothetical protein [Haloferax sp. DFSO52]|uniref:hypothetical protein n=1 Tax=Haloferax sp. DFSO52 TaxID=3388505 RepID=UPI003A8B9B7C
MCDGGIQGDGATGLDAVSEHREELESLAQSDLPINWIAQALLDVLDYDERGER